LYNTILYNHENVFFIYKRQHKKAWAAQVLMGPKAEFYLEAHLKSVPGGSEAGVYVGRVCWLRSLCCSFI